MVLERHKYDGGHLGADSQRLARQGRGAGQSRGQRPGRWFICIRGYGLVWDEFLDLLARDFTVYAPEHPGTSAGLPDAVKPLDDRVGPDPVLLTRCSTSSDCDRRRWWAIPSAGWWPLNLPPTTARASASWCLIDSLGLWRDDTPIKNYMVMAQADVEPLLFHDRTHPSRKHIFPNFEDPDSIVRLTWALACTGKFIWPIPDKGLNKRIHRITAPTLIIWGKQDGLTPPLYANEFARLIPQLAGSRSWTSRAHGAAGAARRSRIGPQLSQR